MVTPTIQGTAQRRDMPGSNFNPRSATPADFGSTIGAGLEQLGNSETDAATAIQKFQLAKDAETERLANFDRQTTFINFGADQTSKLEQQARDTAGPAQDFTKNALTQFDTDAKTFLDAIPEHSRPEWQAKMAAMRAGYARQALQTEFSQRDAYYHTTIGTSLGTLANSVSVNPGALDTSRAAGDAVIDGSGLSAEDKLDYKAKWHGQVALAAATGDIQADPHGALVRLGGVPEETKLEAKTGMAPIAAEGQANTPFAAVKQQIIAHEAPASAGGYNAVVYNTPGGGNAAGVQPPKPLTTMTIGEIVDWQRGPLRDATRGKRGAGDVGSTGVGAFQFESGTLEQNAKAVFGAKWRDQVFSPGTQDAVAEHLWNTVKGDPGKLSKTWAAFSGSGPAGAPAAAQPAGTMGYAYARPGEPATNEAAWDRRADGSQKGHGFLGLLRRPDGGVSSEISIGVEINGKETDIPTMVPGLTKPELTALMTKPEEWVSQSKDALAQSIRDKAVAHAKDRMAAGKSPFADASESPDVQQGLAGPHVDPRYADLPFEQRQQLIGAAQREISQREQVQVAQQQATHANWLNQFMIDLNDGKAGEQDIAAARSSGMLTDYDEIKRAQDVVDTRNKKQADLNYFNAAIGTPGFTWNPYNDQQKKAVEAAVKDRAASVVTDAKGQQHVVGTVQAAFDIWQKTGMLAEEGATALRGGLVSTNGQQVQVAANIAGNMLRRNPNAFAGVQGGEDMERSALAFNHYTYDLGMSPDEASKRIAAENTPEYKAKIKIGQPQLDEYRKQLRKDGAADASQVFARWGRDPTFRTPGQKAEADETYTELVVDNLQHGYDMSTAKAIAGQQLQRVYGVTGDGGNRIAKYPPEKGYPPIGGSWQYVYDDALATAKQHGHADAQGVLLQPIPGVTDQDFRTGRPPRYTLYYTHAMNGQQVLERVPGQFAADTHAAATNLTAQRGPQFEQERLRQQAEKAEEQARVRARFGNLPGM